MTAWTPLRADLSARQMTMLLWAVGLASVLVWSDSIGRYLQARHHLATEDWWAAVGLGADGSDAPAPPAGATGSAQGRGRPAVAGIGSADAGSPEAQRSDAAAPGASVAAGALAGAATSLPSSPSEPADRTAPGTSGTLTANPALSPTAAAASDSASASTSPTASASASASGLAQGPAPAASGAAVSGSAEPLPPGQYLATAQRQRLLPGPQRVLFAGDSMMQGVAPLAIQALRKQYPDWVFHDLSRESTGLTVGRVFDWPSRIIEEMEARKLTLVVIFLGPNDPWDIYEKRQVLRFPSPAWEARYATRVAEILRHAVAREVRVVWMGLPSMRAERLHQGAVIQNRVFHTQAQAHGTDFLATEPLLGLLSEPYRKTGAKDPERSASLRAEDGIHFTPTGQRLLRDALVQHLVKAVGTPP